MNQQVKFEHGATLEFTPPEGRATAATVTIKTSGDLDLTTAVEDAAVTVDPVNTTVDADSGVSEDNPRLVRLTATTGIRVGGIYLLTGAGGSELVDVEAVATGDYVTAKSPLKYDYASGATFVGTRLTYALTAGNSQNPDGDCDTDFRAEWTYTVDSVEYINETLYDVSRHPWYRAATSAGLKRWNSDLLSQFDEDGETNWEDDLDEAFDQIIRIADARGWRPGALLGMNHLIVPTYWQLVLSKAYGNLIPPHAANDPDLWLDRCMQNLDKALDLAESNITWIDKDQDNAKDEDETGAALLVKRWSS